MQWRYASEAFGEIDSRTGIVLKVVKALGGFRIRVEIEVRTGPRQAGETLELVHLWGRLQAGSLPVCLLVPDGNNRFGTTTTTRAVTASLGADVDHRRMEAMDGARNTNGDLVLVIDIGGAIAGSKGVETFNAQDTFTVPQAQWLAALSESGYGSTLLIELLVPRGEADPQRSRAIEAMGKAVRELRRVNGGDDAAAACRIAFEELGIGASVPPTLELRARDGRPYKDFRTDERFDLLLFAAKLVTHPAHHTIAPGYSRAQAKAITEIAASVIALRAKSRE